jgi:hypothetical protein
MRRIDANRGSPRSSELAPSDAGFQGQLRCASLADLIQLECGNRNHSAVSVDSDGREGHLFFDDGQIVHARAGDRVGEAAVFEILDWTTGTFAPSTLPWPITPTVTSTWQQLLLRAAQRRDEQQPAFAAASTSRLRAVREPSLLGSGAAPSSATSDVAWPSHEPFAASNLAGDPDRSLDKPPPPRRRWALAVLALAALAFGAVGLGVLPPLARRLSEPSAPNAVASPATSAPRPKVVVTAETPAPLPAAAAAVPARVTQPNPSASPRPGESPASADLAAPDGKANVGGGTVAAETKSPEPHAAGTNDALTRAAPPAPHPRPPAPRRSAPPAPSSPPPAPVDAPAASRPVVSPAAKAWDHDSPVPP